MNISVHANSTSLRQLTNDNMAKVKQAFQSLDSAMTAGDLEAAKTAYTQLQQYAPSNAGSASSNPMQQKMDALGSALESGDLQAAQTAYADVKTAMAQRPAGAQGSQGGGRPAGGPPPGGGVGKASSSSNSVTYDPRDSNKDGAVSVQEALMYSISHPSGATSSTGADTTGEAATGNQERIDVRV